MKREGASSLAVGPLSEKEANQPLAAAALRTASQKLFKRETASLRVSSGVHDRVRCFMRGGDR